MFKSSRLSWTSFYYCKWLWNRVGCCFTCCPRLRLMLLWSSVCCFWRRPIILLMHLTPLFRLSPVIWVRTRFPTLLQMLLVAFVHSLHCKYKYTQTHTHKLGGNWLSRPLINDIVASVDVDSCSATQCVCTCHVFGFARLSVILRKRRGWTR